MTNRVRSSAGTSIFARIQATASGGRIGLGSVERRASRSNGKYFVTRGLFASAILPFHRRPGRSYGLGDVPPVITPVGIRVDEIYGLN